MKKSSSPLNAIWLFLIVSATVVAAYNGNMAALTEASFTAAESAVTLAIGLIGAMALWLGIMKVAEAAGMMRFIARLIRPLMNCMNILKTLATIIKVISTIFMSSAIGWELWNIYAVINNISIPSSLNFIFWLERFAITAHLIEAVIAAFYAPKKQKMPIKYAIYTFFVGTVALIELFAKEDNSIKNPV